jgi:hypothetical protein
MQASTYRRIEDFVDRMKDSTHQYDDNKMDDHYLSLNEDDDKVNNGQYLST